MIAPVNNFSMNPINQTPVIRYNQPSYKGLLRVPHSTYLPEKMGSASVEPSGRFEAGSYQEFTLTYTAGYFGIDD